MTTLAGTVERITYTNAENGYTVLRLRPVLEPGESLPGIRLDGLVTVVGNLPDVAAGEQLRLEGDFTSHPKHGLQFKASHLEKLKPVTLEGIERYLGSGMIKGIGPEMAHRIVQYFKTETLEVIEKDSWRLREVPGIGPDRMEKIITAWEAQKQVNAIMIFLHSHKITTNLAVKIFKTYGNDALAVLRENPYRLEQDIYGVGFKTADRIARDLGLPADHPSRIEAGIAYVLEQSQSDGHVFLPEALLQEKATDLLGVDSGLFYGGVERLINEERIQREPVVLKEGESDAETVDAIYLRAFLKAEKGVAARLRALLAVPVPTRQGQFNLASDTLSEEQLTALEHTLQSPVSVLTGGPGTGKTTCMRALIELLEGWGVRYALASPTGRAAKRLTETTGRPASTIHRLLGYSPEGGFRHYEKNPLAIEFLVVDEASMLDLLLTHQLLRALKPGTQVLLVGDVDQLPSVGAGDVLRDIIRSGVVPVSRLRTIYRQAGDSAIITNAHRINQGQMPEFSGSELGDFFLFPADSADKAAEWVVDLVAHRVPTTFDLNAMTDVQVLSPMYRGAAGVDALNQKLQATLNPPAKDKIEQKLAGGTFRVGDKVMQIRNNYDKDVYNGDIGLLTSINRIDHTLTVRMDEMREVVYDFTEADELVLAYAVSVHKAQGSEFPAVVMPVLTQHYVMLQRNLLYTGVTRAAQRCVLVGNTKAIGIAIRQNKVSERYSGLRFRLKQAGI
ncbi:ATP-dependent RecD-like DNA helicase (plasmid) [Chloroflexota bacterium]|nr:ATP-dependent RecD-like DNA helicase [Chloroflexota bacterium]